MSSVPATDSALPLLVLAGDNEEPFGGHEPDDLGIHPDGQVSLPRGGDGFILPNPHRGGLSTLVLAPPGVQGRLEEGADRISRLALVQPDHDAWDLSWLSQLIATLPDRACRPHAIDARALLRAAAHADGPHLHHPMFFALGAATAAIEAASGPDDSAEFSDRMLRIWQERKMWFLELGVATEPGEPETVEPEDIDLAQTIVHHIWDRPHQSPEMWDHYAAEPRARLDLLLQTAGARHSIDLRVVEFLYRPLRLQTNVPESASLWGTSSVLGGVNWSELKGAFDSIGLGERFERRYPSMNELLDESRTLLAIAKELQATAEDQPASSYRPTEDELAEFYS